VRKIGMVQKRLNHLYNFGAPVANHFTFSLVQIDSGALKICKAEFAENEPCRKIPFSEWDFSSRCQASISGVGSSVTYLS
jgi:hypothetical protein